MKSYLCQRGHTLQSGPGPGSGPSVKADPGHLGKADPIPKIIFDRFEGADFKYENSGLKF